VPDMIGYSVAQGVAHIRLNRPEVSNALDLETARAFASVVEQAATNEEVRAALVTGEGRRFCAGGDVASFAQAADQPSYIHQLASQLDAGFQRLANLETPVVAAVHGAVAGAGLALMLSCDVIVADPATKFVFAYPAIGFTPDCGLSYLLPRSIGQHRALRFALMGEPASAEDAYAWGMVTEVSADAVGRGTELAISLASGSAKALGQCRRLIRSGWEMDRAGVGAEETRTVTEMVKGAEAQRLIARFGAASSGRRL
jgi:2-(1,2-epoxy-1,2-dihydrophenyl)acetyl-CoA isomerase